MLESELHRSAEAARSAKVKSRTFFTVDVSDIRLINSSARTEPLLPVKPIQKKPYRTSDYVSARTASSMPDRPFQKSYRANRHVSAPSVSSASAVSPLAQALEHSKPRSMLKLAIKLSKKIRGYTKEKLMEVRKELAQYCSDVLKMMRLL